MLERSRFIAGLSGCVAVVGAHDSRAWAAPRLETGPALQVSIERIVADFTQRAYAAGLPNDVRAPGVLVESTPRIASYNRPTNRIVLADYDTLPEPVQQNFVEWAGFAENGWSGRRLVDEMFHWFFVPHELTHWAQSRAGTREYSPQTYDVEYEANRSAVAYWRGTRGGAERLAALVAAFRRIRDHLPDPVPPGAEMRAYLRDNFSTLVRTPASYGWYQLGMVIDAARRPAEPFATVMRDIAERPAPVARS